MALAFDRRLYQPVRSATCPTTGRLAVRQLRLAAFRSYAQLRLAIDPRPVVLTGPNGAGKTNLLEAISFLVPGRGLRRARLAEVDRQGDAAAWTVAATVDGPGGPCAIGTGREPGGRRERRLDEIAGAPASQATLADAVAAIWLVPAMDRLFQDGAGARRRFLDRLVLAGDPAHAAQVARYGHALKERQRLLRGGRFDRAWLEALEGRAAAAGIAIAAARRQTVAGLRAALAQPSGAFPRPGLALRGDAEASLDELPALDAEARLAEALANSRAQDAESGTTAAGPHRSDLEVHDLASGRAAADCSTGEQKALLIGIVLAEARLRCAEGSRLPLLLLDEVTAHLDPARRLDLFEQLCALGAQAWLTGTDPALFAPLGGRAQYFSVRDSTLQPYGPDAHSAA
ncbi:MAG TPA: DNA replication/repair protein RecF [Geminicoccaceae bacterium]|nr:DNA replication/repair protein RecF [Geminicoccaceae bacterium]